MSEDEHAQATSECDDRGIFDLTGKVAVVTGGGSGLGRTICEVLAAYGADVVAVGRTASKLQETLRGLPGARAESGAEGDGQDHLWAPGGGGRCLGVMADVNTEDGIEAMVQRVKEEYGRLDIFFANAGIRERSFVPIHEKRIADWDEVLDADLRSVFLQMRAVFPVMMEQKRGSFVTVSSVGGMPPLANDPWVYNQTAYAVAKAGVIMLTKAAARQYGPYGIRVNCIAPGYHRTPLTPVDEIAEVEATLSKLLPLGRTGMPEEMKGLALWLASDASSFVTGQVMVEDGGYLA